ncbi:MAG: ribonuclease III [Anaerolineales bacterium]
MLPADALIGQLGIEIANRNLVQRALTHRSYVNENKDALEDNERLEFLGDAALDFVAAAWLYRHFPEMDEGQLTLIRSALVRTEQLATFAEQIDLGDALLLGHGEEMNGGRKRPALLCATFEALIGAIYLSEGYPAVEEFMQPRIQAAVEKILEDESLFDARSLLQIWAQSELGETPAYRTVSSSGPDHERTFEVVVEVGDDVQATGTGASKQAAAQRAAAAALASIGWPNLAVG